MNQTETELLERKAIANILFEEGPPRYKGCPPICTIANLPSFETARSAEAWHEKNAPGCKIESPYRCPSCNWFHYKSYPRDPAGDTSGTTRTQKHKKDPKKSGAAEHKADCTDASLNESATQSPSQEVKHPVGCYQLNTPNQ